MAELELTCGQCSGKFKIDDIGSDKVFCTFCGAEVPVIRDTVAQPQPEPVSSQSEIAETQLPDHCPTCGMFTPAEKQYQCTVCDKSFCDNCPGLHIPPRTPELEAKVIYKYKPRTSTVWIGDTHTFLDKLPSPLCQNCYDKEFARVMWRMKWNIKNWKVDMLRDESIKIIEETPPGERKIITEALKAKEREARSARELLAHLTKGK